ncbi:CvpA family protein [Limnohabitans sp. Rim8]|jgi:membrane protein required for colicin V production|uniref:CvpA family protein n=1 Tax=Limnohabitans sp. Rim8 TaxID=1100718 RepID=UPI00260A280A|nr:CvpA family protein [Limnohabitans sp. Rim8]
MSNLDWLFSAILVIAMAAGAYRGWLPQALSLLGLVVTLFAVVYLGPLVSAHLPLSGPGESLRKGLGALLALVITLYLAHLGVRLHRYLFTHKGVQPAHRSLGAAFGLISGVIICLGLSTLIELTELREEDWWQGSIEKKMAESTLQTLKSKSRKD